MHQGLASTRAIWQAVRYFSETSPADNDSDDDDDDDDDDDEEEAEAARAPKPQGAVKARGSESPYNLFMKLELPRIKAA